MPYNIPSSSIIMTGVVSGITTVTELDWLVEAMLILKPWSPSTSSSCVAIIGSQLVIGTTPRDMTTFETLKSFASVKKNNYGFSI